jgi:hypothetical protein
MWMKKLEAVAPVAPVAAYFMETNWMTTIQYYT